MLTHRVIPCLDVKAGRVVKGVNFVELRDAGDPVEIACGYDAAGADELVFLDITASSDNRNITYDMVERVAEQCFMPFTVGGGIRTVEDVTRLVQAGAEKVSINTAAVLNPDIVNQTARRFGRCATVVNIDPKRVPVEDFVARTGRQPQCVLEGPGDEVAKWPSGHVAHGRSEGLGGASSLDHSAPRALGRFCLEVHTHGGRTPTGIEALPYAREVVQRGAGEIILTSMDADGTKAGYDVEATRLIADAVNVPVVASGGCGSPEHMIDVLRHTRADAVLAASIFHYGTYSIAQTKQALAAAGLPVRIPAATG